MKFQDPLVLADGALICAIEGFGNGCFTIVTRKNDRETMALFYSQTGDLKEHIYQESDKPSYIVSGCFLDDGRYHYVSTRDEGNDLFRRLGGEDCQWKKSHDVFYVFANNWYVQRVGNARILYNAEGHVVESLGHLGEIKMFNLGYAVEHQKEALQFEYFREWCLALLNGVNFASFKNIEFFGDGNFLLNKALYDFNGKKLLDGPFIKGENLFDGKFILTTEDGYQRMYRHDGTAFSEVIADAEFMPDGCFVQYENKQIIGIYHPYGIVDNHRDVWTYEKAGLYYLLNNENDKGLLYDYQEKAWGKNFELLKSEENFSLFKQNQEMVLFNQFGEVLRLQLKA